MPGLKSESVSNQISYAGVLPDDGKVGADAPVPRHSVPARRRMEASSSRRRLTPELACGAIADGPGEATRYARAMSSASTNSSEHDDSATKELNERLRDAYDENGVDRSLIRWSLARSPTERVMAVEATLNALATVRRIDPPR